MEALNQAKNLIQRAQNILIIPASEPQGDSLGSALALFYTLKELGKNVNLLFTEKIPDKFQFLTNLPLGPAQDFVVTVNTSGKTLSKMHYEKNENDLKIYLTLNKGELEAKDVALLPRLTTETSLETNGKSFYRNPDLIIVLGAKSLEDVAEIFDKNPRLFYETTTLNLDNHPLNENFGEVNLIDVSSSLAEISTELIKSLDPAGDYLRGGIATCLLVGVIYASQNFRNPKTRPKTFETSAFLIEKGADHQKIVQHLYKQKDISQIRILGRILEKLNFDEKKDVYLATLAKSDFENCQATSRDLGFVIEELKLNFRYLPNLLILWESHASPSLIKGVFYSSQFELIEKILRNFEGISRGEGALFLVRDSDLNSAKEKILQIL